MSLLGRQTATISPERIIVVKVNKDILGRYGFALRQARIKAGMTQEEAAEKAGVARTKWSYYEHGKKNITLMTAERLANAVGSDLSRMLRRSVR